MSGGTDDGGKNAALRDSSGTAPSVPARATELLVPISPGELIDKLTILAIKRARIAEPAKLANVAREEASLAAVAAQRLPSGDPAIAAWSAELRAVNETLWDVEDALREAEAAGDFGPAFVALARSVYKTNDRRAELKRLINAHLGSALVEEKSYAGPRPEA